MDLLWIVNADSGLIFFRQIMEKNWKYSGTVHLLFIGFKKDLDS